MFDLALIGYALECAQTYGNDSVDGAKLINDAIDEFAKLRKAIEEAPSAKVARVSEYYRRGKMCSLYVGNLPIDWRGHDVLLVKCDE